MTALTIIWRIGMAAYAAIPLIIHKNEESKENFDAPDVIPTLAFLFFASSNTIVYSTVTCLLRYGNNVDCTSR